MSLEVVVKMVIKPHCLVRKAWKMRFDLGNHQAKYLSERDMCQLSYCKTDECRRLILGISK